MDASGAPVDPSVAAQHYALAVAVCETLDTPPPLAAPASGGANAQPGGSGQAHCVEQARP